MKTYKEITLPVPVWYNEEFHKTVCEMLESGNKLKTVKFICDESTFRGTRNDFGLREAKDLCDEIAPPTFRVPAPNEIPLITRTTDNREALIHQILDEIETMDFGSVYKRGQLQRLLTNVPTTVLNDFLDSI